MAGRSAPFAPPGWAPPTWMRCPVRCRLRLDIGADAEPLVLDFAGDRLQAVDPAGAGPDRPDEQVVVEASAAFVDAWLHDPDVLLGDVLGPQLRFEGQLFLVSLFDGLVGQHKAVAERLSAS